MELNKIYNMDCLEGMKQLPDNSVDAVITDPPYGLSFMGKKWDYDVPSQAIWEECLRVLKPGGYLLSFAGTRTQHRIAARIEDAGFEIRDMIAWIYGSGFPKSLNIGKAVDKLQGNEREVTGERKVHDIRGGALMEATVPELKKEVSRHQINITKGTSEWEGWGTALKPALEPITIARKPLSEPSVAENVLKWGTGGINIDECRIEGDKDFPKFRAYSKGQFGGTEGKGAIGMKITPVEYIDGRFPANLIHDGSDEVLAGFPDVIEEELGIVQKTLTGGVVDSITINASRFFYCAKASKEERNKGCESLETRPAGGMQGRNDGSMGSITLNKNFHPTVKPVALMEYLIRLVSRAGAIILDPFMGSGTTAVACKQLNRNFIGFEISPEYCEIANKRLQQKGLGDYI